ncbi:MAG: hypothetical protein NTZ46_07990 [Verrucomicrobia bacterium]|nr:hypothetical protein [Verrucomicrobiota bacterium]
MSNLRELGTERVVTDLIGSPESLDGWMPAMENAGFQPYKHLARMARTTAETALPRADVTFAERRDIPAILCFLEEAFDRYSKQLPAPEEIEAAVDASQILLSKSRPMFDGLLFFETHGVLSTLRFWAVASACRGKCIGSSLIRHYLATQTGVRRFVLWVNAEDQDVVQKYQHYHYASDGVVDYVLTNDCMFG